MRVLLVILCVALAVRFLPGLLLMLVLAFPRERKLGSICLVGSIRAVEPRKDDEPQPARRLVRLKPLLISSSVLAILALAAVALVEWRPAGLMLLLR